MRLGHGAFDDKGAPLTPLIPHVEEATARGVALVLQFSPWGGMVDRKNMSLSWRHDPPTPDQWEEALWLVYSLTQISVLLLEKAQAFEVKRNVWHKALKDAQEKTGLPLIKEGNWGAVPLELDDYALARWRERFR